MYLSLVQKQTFFLALAALRLVSADLSTTETPTDGVVVGHLFPACNGHRAGGHKALTVPVDRCLTTPGLAIQIKQAAVCNNGTRAQLARFPDKKCGHGTLSESYGLIPVADSDIGSCMSTGVLGGEESFNSVAFWCDGVKKSSPEDGEKKGEDDNTDTKKPRAGSVSESACVPGRAPFFAHPKTDTCVNLRTSKMRVYSAGICANGTQSTLALYKEKSCVGGPATFLDIGEKDTKTCLDLSESSSFAFYCTGAGIEDSDGSPTGPDRPRENGGSVMHFLLVLSLICMMFFLMLVLSIYTWIRKYGGSAGKVIQVLQGFLKPKDGGIAI